MLDDPISWQYKKTIALKSRLLEFNIQSFTVPVLHASMFIMFLGYVISGVISTDIIQHGTDYQILLFSKYVSFLPLIIISFLYVAVFDKIVLGFMYYIKTINDAVFKSINHADHKLWRKTGKDAPISSVILKFSIWLARQPRYIKFLIMYGLPLVFIIQHIFFFF